VSELGKQRIDNNSILYIKGEKCMIFPKVQFVARGQSPRATKHRGRNEHSLQKYIQGVPELAPQRKKGALERIY
jgi:hypothetical protein